MVFLTTDLGSRLCSPMFIGEAPLPMIKFSGLPACVMGQGLGGNSVHTMIRNGDTKDVRDRVNLLFSGAVLHMVSEEVKI